MFAKLVSLGVLGVGEPFLLAATVGVHCHHQLSVRLAYIGVTRVRCHAQVDGGSELECGICFTSTSARCVLSCSCAQACSDCGTSALSAINGCPFCRSEGVRVVVHRVFV